MNILIPMAGAGKRFSDAGYTIRKPLIPTTDRVDGLQYPMVVCAVRDVIRLAGPGQVIFVDRCDDDVSVREVIKRDLPSALFIGVDHLTEGQACTCLLAEDLIDNDQPLFVAGCDNGMVADCEKFANAVTHSDVLVFTYRHNDCVVENPNAYGWVLTNDNVHVKGVSVKKSVSDTPMEDHAIVASFWFKRGKDFVHYTKRMIDANDRVNKEFYVDQVMKYCVEGGLNVQIFEIDRYLGWGTPQDYENYEKTISYWKQFVQSEKMLK